MSERMERNGTWRIGAVVAFPAVLSVLIFLSGCGASLVPSKDAWYAEHYYIMQKFEQDVYKKLSGPAKLQFRDLFWQARKQETRQLFDSRMAYINRTFQKENRNQPWNTDRGRIYLLNGNPASIDYKQNNDWAMQTSLGSGGNDRTNEDVSAMTSEVWTYEHNGQFIYYTFNYAPGNQWRMQNKTDQARYLGELQQDNRSRVFGPLDENGYRGKLQALLEIR